MVFLVVVGGRPAPAAIPKGLGSGKPVRRRRFGMIEDVEEHLEHILGNGARELARVVRWFCHGVMSQRWPGLAPVIERKTHGRLALVGR